MRTSQPPNPKPQRQKKPRAAKTMVEKNETLTFTVTADMVFTFTMNGETVDRTTWRAAATRYQQRLLRRAEAPLRAARKATAPAPAPAPETVLDKAANGELTGAEFNAILQGKTAENTPAQANAPAPAPKPGKTAANSPKKRTC